MKYKLTRNSPMGSPYWFYRYNGHPTLCHTELEDFWPNLGLDIIIDVRKRNFPGAKRVERSEFSDSGVYICGRHVALLAEAVRYLPKGVFYVRIT